MKIGILGGGSWGTALATVLSDNKHKVDIWVRDRQQCLDINQDRENKKYLPGVTLDDNISVYNDIKRVIEDKDFILLSLPTHTIRDNLNSIKNLIKEDQIIINVAKGIENDTLYRISEIVKEILPDNEYVILSGPSHAEEVGLNHPTTVIASSTKEEAAKQVQDLFINENFRVYTNLDLVGVELGGALKNIIALAAGVSDGLGYGDNAKAALINRGIFEMAKLGRSLGGDMDTFLGLSGIGDLIVTCTSYHSRNRKAGVLLGQGLSKDEASQEVGMVVEGIKTTKSAYELSRKNNIEMPITEELYKLLYEGQKPELSVKNLMNRERKNEMDL